MKTIVITGSTRGLGYGLADAFLALECQVVVSGRTEDAVYSAVGNLAERHKKERIHGQPCDVGEFSQVQALWEAAQERFGRVDIWINNAGSGQGMMKFWEIEADQIKEIVETNLTGTMYGAQVAIRGMLAQGFGALYNMEGSGSDGRVRHGLTVYGSSKRGGRFLTDALIQEIADTPVIVGALSPGMLVTELVTGQMDRDSEEWERLKGIMNIIADRVETVAPWLAGRVLANEKNGASIRWLTRGKLMRRFLTAPFNKRDLFSGHD
jgi:NAD(P)-dependent dehydrogenase (short-subunit alcohol dehydrogenase family)